MQWMKEFISVLEIVQLYEYTVQQYVVYAYISLIYANKCALSYIPTIINVSRYIQYQF